MCEDNAELDYLENESDLRPMISREAWRKIEAALRRSPSTEDEALRKLYAASR